MKQLFLVFMTILFFIPAFSLNTSANIETGNYADNLLISEYVEGSGFNKAVEIYNGTGQPVDLSEYTLSLFSNGNVEANSQLQLEGTLLHNETLVIAHSSASEDILTQAHVVTGGVTNFNGDDALVLYHNKSIIDRFGQVGERENWGRDVTLVRDPSVLSGDTNVNDVFVVSNEWLEYPINTFDHLGTHEANVFDEASETPTDTIEEDGVEDEDASPETPAEEAPSEDVLTIKEARQLEIGEQVTVRGTIVAKLTNTAHIDDGTNGIALFPVRDIEANVGETVVVTGTLGEYNGLLQLQNVEVNNVVDTVTVTPQVILGGEVGEAVESQLVRINDLEVRSVSRTGNGWTNYNVEANGFEFILRDETNAFNITEDTIFESVTGIISEFNGEYQIIPRDASDFVGDTSVISDPVSELMIHDIQGEGHYSPYDGETVENVEGIVTYIYEIRGSQYFHMQTPDNKVDDNPNTSEGIIIYTGNTLPDIQVGDLVHVTGTVNEYHIEGFSDRENTDLPVTQIVARNDRGGSVNVIERDVELPAPYIIDSVPSEISAGDHFETFNRDLYAIDFWESLEGMRVQTDTVRAVGPQAHGDIITVLDSVPSETVHGGILLEENDQNGERIHFKLYDNRLAREFNVVTGDRFEGPLIGYVNYGFQNYKVNIDLETMQSAHIPGNIAPESTFITPEEDKLTIASYNLENFSNNPRTTSEEKALLLGNAIANQLNSPDIVGVTEVQDNDGPDSGGPEANESYERLIENIVAQGGPRYEYVNIDPLFNEDGGQPDANIRVGFLYNPDRVSFVDNVAHGDAETPVEYVDGHLTINPGRIDPNHPALISTRKPLVAEFDFKGEQIIVIANHWNSKRGDDPLFGSQQPVQYHSEVQRVEIAKIVAGFINEVKTDNPNANIVSLGDFNDFQWTDALITHEGSHMTNMVNHVPLESRYSYVYQGNSQVLDHILVSNNLVEHTVIDMLHINADFTDMSGRASDHDPLIVQINMTQTNDSTDGTDVEDVNEVPPHSAQKNNGNGPPEHAKHKGRPEHSKTTGPPKHSNSHKN